MSARTTVIDAAVMHDQHSAIERLANGVGGSDVGGHVLVAILGAAQRAVEGVEHDGGGLGVAKGKADRGDKLAAVLYKVEDAGLKVERGAS